ncbi:MAG: hypothetical protein HYS45_03200 [Parcubacteria group bacterium]|nr:hypothetical protein [Parcubacteria group bacterium]
MFEDQHQNQNALQPAGAAPSVNRGIEDIFAGTDAVAQTLPQSSKPSPQTIPGPPTALAGGKLKPLAGNAPGIPTLQASGSAGAGFPFKKLFIIVFVSLGIIGAGAAAFVVLQGRSDLATPALQLGAPQDAAAPTAAQDTSAASTVSRDAEDTTSPDVRGASPDTSAILQDFQQSQIDRALNPIPQDPASIDTDQDGLSDAQEFGQGTNPRLVDSDGDALSDWEETAIFGTDPLNVDSDADSYLDGEEVQNGYNPLGAGKLLNFEKAKAAAE